MKTVADNTWTHVPAGSGATVYKLGNSSTLTVFAQEDCNVNMAINGAAPVLVRTIAAGTGEVAFYAPPCDITFDSTGAIDLYVDRIRGTWS